MAAKKMIYGGEILTQGPNDLWRTHDGVVMALQDEGSMTDPVARCGVGALSLPVESRHMPGCRPHDFATSSPAYQKFRTRSESDRMLLDHQLLIAGRNPLIKAVAYAMYGACRLTSWAFWENPETRWK